MSIRRQVRQALIVGVIAVAALGGLIAAGQALRHSLRTSDRYQFAFHNIECAAPAGMSREQFLGEVRYYGEFAEMISLLDPGLAESLKSAFARHAWVERVDGIDIQPHRVQARLVLRQPVLAVAHGPEGTVRAVDRHGILLPRGAHTLGLPRFRAATEPAGPSGQPWGDPAVTACARVAGDLKANDKTPAELMWENGEVRLRFE